jgi:putative acetyltransferase
MTHFVSAIDIHIKFVNLRPRLRVFSGDNAQSADEVLVAFRAQLALFLRTTNTVECKMLISVEYHQDDYAVHKLTIAAFKRINFSDGLEAPIIRAFRDAGDLTISLVDENKREIVGHIAFSMIAIRNISNNWFGLCSLSVRLDLQRNDIGTSPILEDWVRLRANGARGSALFGHPAYYSSAGFESDGRRTYGSLRTELVQRFVFVVDKPHGEMRFAAAFDLEHS